MRGFFWWLFSPTAEPRTCGGTVLWWEKRRFAYNAIVLGAGFISFVVFLASIMSSGTLVSGEDAVEPFVLIVLLFAINLAYTLGWLVEAPLRALFSHLPARFGPVLFGVGLGFSVIVVLVPGVYWGVFRILQLLGFAT